MAKTFFNDPTGEEHNGMPTFTWGQAPRDVYATRRQLAARGLRKGGQDVAAEMHCYIHGRERVVYLYRIDLAKPQFAKTPAKLAAVQTAAKSRYRCDGPCGRRWPELEYIPRFGTCNDCRDGKYIAPAAPVETCAELAVSSAEIERLIAQADTEAGSKERG